MLVLVLVLVLVLESKRSNRIDHQCEQLRLILRSLPMRIKLGSLLRADLSEILICDTYLGY
ncbi:MAG: hypothetical protein NTV29_18730 [Planctomycetota bacterium]|nr:hypothetical protein [Planctomycetota bacterium]